MAIAIVMRIYGNRQLKTLPGQATRPTTGRVREALFNIWQGRIEGCRWLDLCAGNGSMGAEALCRNALEVVGIEQNPQACTIIRQNWQKIGHPAQKFRVLRGDVLTRLSSLRGESFDRIYFDPPYASNLYERVLEGIVGDSLLSVDGEIAVEHDPKIWQAMEIPGLVICRSKIYSNTALTFYNLLL
jgi:16S rRNA (guanine(966)-N(2))-methyltransferase RsmD